MTVPEGEKPVPNPEAVKPAAKATVDATKYVGTPAVGTSKAAASAGLNSAGPSNTEIDHEAREEARQLGITQFEMTAGLNDSPKFIRALREMVMDAMGTTVQAFASMGEPSSLASGILVAAD